MNLIRKMTNLLNLPITSICFVCSEQSKGFAKEVFLGAREMDLRLGALTVLEENLGLVSSTHKLDYNYL